MISADFFTNFPRISFSPEPYFSVFIYVGISLYSRGIFPHSELIRVYIIGDTVHYGTALSQIERFQGQHCVKLGLWVMSLTALSKVDWFWDSAHCRVKLSTRNFETALSQQSNYRTVLRSSGTALSVSRVALSQATFCNRNKNGLTKFLQLKGQCHESFYHFFLLKRFDLGPIWTGKNCFAKFFVFVEIFDRKVQKSGVCVVVDYSDPRFSRISLRKRKSSRNHFCIVGHS